MAEKNLKTRAKLTIIKKDLGLKKEKYSAW
jgi:hypothetical protein